MSITLPDSPRQVRRWPLALIALPAAVAVWSGWVGLGQLCGFGIVHPLPGIVPGFRLNTAITLPVGVEAYASFALGAWLHPAVPERAKSFARRSAIGALGLGMLGQVAYHVLSAAHAIRAPWPVVVLVACLPVVTLGFGVALAHLLRGEDLTTTANEEPIAVDLLTARNRPSLRLAWPVPVADSGPVADRAARPATTRSPRRSRRPAKPAAKAAAIVASEPDISGAELGRRLKVSERTGRRLLAQVQAA